MSSPISRNEYFSTEPYYSEPIRNLLHNAEKKSIYYTIPNRIFKILAQKTDFDMQEKNNYLDLAKKIQEAKKTNCRQPWNETAEFKKDKESKLAFETKVIQSIKDILGEAGIKEVMKLPFNPLKLFISSKQE